MNQKAKLLFGAAALVAVVGLSAGLYQFLQGSYAPPEVPAPAPGSSNASEPEKIQAPDFSVTDVDGNTVKLSEFIGKPVVVNFWASWCPPCRDEMPGFETAWKELGDDVPFLMINATDGQRETEEKGRTFIAEQEFTFPVYYDLGLATVSNYGVSSFPTTLFIDKDGFLVTASIGGITEEKLREKIALIQEPES